MGWGLKKEVLRKIVHLLSLLYLVIYLLFYHIFSHQYALFALSAVLILLIEFEYFRVEMAQKLPIIHLFWKHTRRPREKDRVGGDVFFLLGSLISLAIYDIRVAFAAILMTTFGDLASSLVGITCGKTWINVREHKALEGAVAEFVVNFAVGFIILRTNAWFILGGSVGEPLLPVIFVMSFIATFVETVITKLDDNLLIPLIAGFSGQVTLLTLKFLGFL